MDITTSAGLPEPGDIKTLVVYDPKTGAIVHRHYVITFAGAKPGSSKEMEARAVEMARTQTGFKGGVAVLHADASAFAEPALYRIDLRSRQVVSEPLEIKRAKRTKR